VCYLGCDPTICGNVPQEKSVVIGSEYRFCWFTCDDGREKKRKEKLEKGLFYLFIYLLLLLLLLLYFLYT
jgi:predicted nucleic acid-binding Zn ribbon protein